MIFCGIDQNSVKEYSGRILKTDMWINIDVGTGYGYSPVLLRLDEMKKFSL